ncbi:sensor histidine kinase [Rathayibacter soli]|uniref:sensor histidine kinase n=1 Tax=Rathayibacter soli TaxID=3144168 RepID=UPI0027E524F8|nr:ATP-binding protein [Glaciibacter superstes]
MSLGLPSHLARKANSRALAGATRVCGLTALGLAAVCVIAPDLFPPVQAGSTRVVAKTSALAHVPGAPSSGAQITGVSALIEPASMVFVSIIGVLAVAVLAGMYLLLNRRHSVPFMVATLVVGAVSAFLYALVVLIQSPAYPGTYLFVFALPVIALTFIGGTGSGSLTGIIWATAGYTVGELAVFEATVVTSRKFDLGWPALVAYLIVVAVLALDGLTRNLKRGAQGNILRALRVEQMALVQKSVAADAAADLHDTVLSQLSVLAHTSPGPLGARLRDRIEDSLASWGRDRAAALARDAEHARTVDDLWIESGLASAIEQARDQGLTITVSGNRSVLARLNADRQRAVALAVRQCLANVLLHSGQSVAELTLASGPREVSVMVVDPGRGFDEAQTPADRMGLRRSIRERIERVGGHVAVFSRPGAGTSVSLVLPFSDAPGDVGDEDSGGGAQHPDDGVAP